MPAVEHDPAPTDTTTGFGAVLGATAVWAAINLLIVVAVDGGPPSAAAAGRMGAVLAGTAVVAALMIWLVLRHRPTVWWRLLLIGGAGFWALRLLTTVLG